MVFPGNVQIEDPYSLWGLLRMPIPWRVKRDIARFYLWDMPRIEVEARKDELDHIPFSEVIEEVLAGVPGLVREARQAVSQDH